MIKELINSKEIINIFIEPLENLSAILAKEEKTEKLLKDMSEDNIADFIHSHPALAHEENIIDVNIEKDKYSTDDVENAITEYIKNRKLEIDDAVDKFMDSEIFQIYSDVLFLQKKYEDLITANKQDYGINEYATTELKRMIKKSVIDSTYEFFIDPIKVESVNEKTYEVVISTRNEWTKGVVEAKFKDILQYSCEKIFGMKMKITIVAR